MTAEVELTIIVPCYNVSGYLPTLQEKLLPELNPSTEVIFVDDGSTDSTIDYLEIFRDKILSIGSSAIVIRKSNGGLSDARNAGLQRVSGKWIAFLDPDDYVSPGYYTKLRMLGEDKHADVSCGAITEIFPKTGETRKHAFKPGFYLPSETQSIIWSAGFSACNKLFRRALFATARFDKGIIYEDVALIPSILANAKAVVVTDDVSYFYLRNSNSILTAKNVSREYQVFESLGFLRSRLKDSRFSREFLFIYFRVVLISVGLNHYHKYGWKSAVAFYRQANIDCSNSSLNFANMRRPGIFFCIKALLTVPAISVPMLAWLHSQLTRKKQFS